MYDAIAECNDFWPWHLRRLGLCYITEVVGAFPDDLRENATD
jgi:hypothetical protein